MPEPDAWLAPDRVEELLRELIRIPSVNPSLSGAEPGGERAIAEFARDWLAVAGARAWLEVAAPDRPNVIAEVGQDDGPLLILCGHLDTVGVSGMSIAPFEPRIEGGRVYGRGSYDMKGGVAAIMAAVAALAGSDIRGRVRVALVIDEEHGSLGAEDFVGRHTGDGCVLTEPTEGRLILSHKGFVWAETVTHGRAAHGSRWDIGISAIGRMAHAITALERFDREVLRERVHPDVGPASLHCSVVEGGVGVSTYAPECRLQVERRTLPHESADQVMDELRRVVREAVEDAEIRCVLHRPGLVTGADSEVARAVREAARSVTGTPPAESGVAYWTDAAIFAGAGIPAVNYGPRGMGAHADVEWVELSSVVECARVLEAAAERFCGGRSRTS